MVHEVIGEIRKFQNLETLSAALAKSLVNVINETLHEKKVFLIAISGGTTPQRLYKLIGGTYDKTIPWNAVHVFFCDERYVPHDDRQSNYQMVKENLLDLISIPQENVHPISTDYPNPDESAQVYERELRKYFQDDGSAFDLVLLGMGKEGHTASLFPGSPALDEEKKWVAAVEVNASPRRRITLTYTILNRAARIYFVISGSEKMGAFSEVAKPNVDFHIYPAAGIVPYNGKLVWWIDRAVSGAK